MSDKRSLKSDSLSKQETEKLFQMLELKLSHERQAWNKARSQIRVIRALSFLFLLVLIVGAFFAFYRIYSRAQQQRANKTEHTTIPEGTSY